MRTTLLAAAIFAALSGAAAAQSLAPNTPASDPAVEQQINALQSALHISQTQLPQWIVFAQAMRDNARTSDDVIRQRAAQIQTMSALDNMKSYAQVTRAYADSTQSLSGAFETLWGVLTDEQRAAADSIFRQQATQAAQVKAR